MVYIDYPILKVNVRIGQPAKFRDTKPCPKQNNKLVIILLINFVILSKGQKNFLPALVLAEPLVLYHLQ